MLVFLALLALAGLSCFMWAILMTLRRIDNKCGMILLLLEESSPGQIDAITERIRSKTAALRTAVKDNTPE